MQGRSHLRLAVDEVNVILEGLGNLPFARVYALVAQDPGAGRAADSADQAGKADGTRAPRAAAAAR